METERKLKIEHLQQASNSQSAIEQLQRTISDKEEECTMIRERLNGVELELQKALEENTQLLNQHSVQSDQQSVSPHRRLNSDHCAPF